MNNIKVVAIGGGQAGRMNREVVRLTGKENPRGLFIPTASYDNLKYCWAAEDYFEEKFGCKMRSLYLMGGFSSRGEIEDKVFGSDFIYVGGGNTLQMMKLWRKYGVDNDLMEAARQGIVMAGTSAGAICWFNEGNSDSIIFRDKKRDPFVRVKGLGLINTMVCPHYSSKNKRRASLKRMIKRGGGSAIALEDSSAIEVIGEGYRILKSSKEAKAYLVFREGQKVVEKELPSGRNLRPLSELLSVGEIVV
jgi:dipeptidase E